MPIGGLVLEPGNSVAYETGTWRTLRPIVDMERCSHCMICWIFCPDCSVVVEGGKLIEIDLEHCKGCGICAVECPRDAITMHEEIELREGS
jgi:2-oxoacid:acceptor oxidoreductase delta subunit (pyruvate/2-ketoisovalerate family)